MDADKRAAVCPTADAHGHGDAGRMAGRLFDVNAHDGICAVDILSALKDGDSLLSPYAFSGAWGSLRMGSCC